MRNALCASVNFDGFGPTLLAQPRKPTAESHNRKWSSFQLAKQPNFDSLKIRINFAVLSQTDFIFDQMFRVGFYP